MRRWFREARSSKHSTVSSSLSGSTPRLESAPLSVNWSPLTALTVPSELDDVEKRSSRPAANWSRMRVRSVAGAVCDSSRS